MGNKLVSIVIPSRREKFLQQTIDDLTAKAAGPVQIIAVLDGAWQDPPLKDNPLLTQIHWSVNQGMRAGINAAMRVARGDYVMKLDGHCMVAEGFDEVLKENCDEDWVVVPRRYRLDPETWTNIEDGRPPVDAHFLSYPFERPDDPTCGLHGQIWNDRARARRDVLVDEELSSQGSCYFMHRKYWERRIGPLDDANYGKFVNEFQEVGLRSWLGGGKVMVVKKTWYSHLYKGKKFGTGYGFTNREWDEWAALNKKGRDFTIDFWLNNRWEKRVRDFEWLIDHFWPVPTWPEDWLGRLEEFRSGRLAA